MAIIGLPFATKKNVIEKEQRYSGEFEPVEVADKFELVTHRITKHLDFGCEQSFPSLLHLDSDNAPSAMDNSRL